MSISYHDFQNLSKSILKKDSLTEMDLRTACSRAYYAAWHCSEALDFKLLDNSGKSNTKAGVHEQRIQKFCNFPAKNQDGIASPEIRAIGYMLRQCKNYRARADYNLQETFDHSLCQTSIESCDLLIGKVLEAIRPMDKSNSSQNIESPSPAPKQICSP